MASSSNSVASRNKISFSFGDVGWALKILYHMAKTSGPEGFSAASIKRFITARDGNRERIASIVTPFAVDPYVLRKVVQSIDGDYAFLGGNAFVPRDFDLYVRCSTELSHRGDLAAILFDRWFQGSCLNASPKMYDDGKCPFGIWEEYAPIEPHWMAADQFPKQVPLLEKLVDDYMAQYVGKVEEIGKILRTLVWDTFVLASYGEWPSEGSHHAMQLFDDHYPEFDYALRMIQAGISYKWSDKLNSEVFGIGDWCWRVATHRLRNIDGYKDSPDALTDAIINHSEIDLAKSEGAIRGGFTGGINNTESCLAGTFIHNAKTDDSVYTYLQKDPENVENIMRESLRLFTSIPAVRYVRQEDSFVIDGKQLEPGTSVLMSTYGMQTDPRNWEDPLEFKPERFENTKDVGFMTQPGFAPLGVAYEMGGRPCGARFHNVHMLRTLLSKLLRDYKFTTVGKGFFEMRQMAATSLYCGKARMRVEKR